MTFFFDRIMIYDMVNSLFLLYIYIYIYGVVVGSPSTPHFHKKTVKN